MSETKNKKEIKPVIWPNHGEIFTIRDLNALNPGFPEITLRVRVTNAIERDNVVSCIGHKNFKKGRPTMMLTMNPITQDVLNKAVTEDIVILDSTKALINVVDVKVTSEKSNDSPVSVASSVISNVSVSV